MPPCVFPVLQSLFTSLDGHTPHLCLGSLCVWVPSKKGGVLSRLFARVGTSWFHVVMADFP